jgi:orotate phosphoribosyltransferase
MNLFVDGEFTAHSGETLPFKIDCDALTDADFATLAAKISRRMVRFRDVYGIPRGGVRLGLALLRYCTGSPLDPMLIVDDVLTTGRSMEEARKRFGPNTIGAVIFARGPCPDWIVPLFALTPAAGIATRGE